MSDSTSGNLPPVPHQPIVSKDTLLPVSLSIALMFGGITFTRWLDAQFDSIRESVRTLQIKVEQLDEEQAIRTADRWTKTDHREWEWRLQESLRKMPGLEKFEVPRSK